MKEFNEIREGLWDNIHKKRKSGKPMRKKGEKGAPSDADFARSKTEGFSNWSVEVKTGQIAGKKVKAQKISVKAQSASHAIKLAAKKLGVDWKQLSLGKTQKESADEEVRESVEESTDLYNKDRIQVTRYSMGKGRVGVQISVDRDSINIDGNRLGALIKGLQASLKKYKI